MASRILLPLSWDVENKLAMARDLSRLSVSLDAFSRDMVNQFTPRPVIGAIRVDSVAASFDQVTRVSPKDGATVIVQLPRVNAQLAGRVLYVLRTSQLGTIVLVPPDTTINGEASIALTANVHYCPVLFDGAAYFTHTYEAAAP